jgi:hypothetical protein
VIFCAHARFKGRERSKEDYDEDRWSWSIK